MICLDYASQRQDFLYYKYLRILLSCIVRDTDIVIDIGSNKIDMLSFLHCKKKYSIDICSPLEMDGIISIKEDFLKYEVNTKFNIACCFQVLEHIENAREFSQKILKSAEICLVSVPYKWKYGACKEHIHDPVDEYKMFSWFDCHPVFMDIVESRLISIYIEKDKMETLYTYNNGDIFEFFKSRVDFHHAKQKNNIYKNIKESYSKIICDMHGYSFTSEHELYSKIKDLMCDNNTDVKKLFEIGVKKYPFFTDTFNHPIFLKEYIRYLVDNGQFKTALKVISRKEKIYNIYNKKLFLVLFARAYEKYGFLSRSYAIWKHLEKNSGNSIEISQSIKRLEDTFHEREREREREDLRLPRQPET